MELRGCSQFFYIQTIKSGSIVKVVNVNYRRKPLLKLRTIDEIYSPGDLVDDMNLDRHGVEQSSPRFGFSGRKLVKEEPETFEFDTAAVGDDRSTDDSTDRSFDRITLKQIKDRCKGRKRKRSKSDVARKETVEKCSTIKDDYSDLVPDEDNNDLLTPLRLLRSRLPKHKKAGRKSRRSGDSPLPNRDLSIVKSEPLFVDQEFLSPSSPLHLADEASEHEESLYRNMNYLSLVCYERLSSFGVEDPDNGAAELNVVDELSSPSRKETQRCLLDVAIHKCVDRADPKPLAIEWSSEAGNTKVDYPVVESRCSSDLVVPDYIEEGCSILPGSDAVSTEDISATEGEDFVPCNSQDISCELGNPGQNTCLCLSDVDNYDTVRSTEINHDGDVSAGVNRDGCKHEWPSNNESCGTIAAVDGVLNHDNSLASAVDNPCSTQERNSLVSVCSDSESKNTTVNPPFDARDDELFQGPQLQYPREENTPQDFPFDARDDECFQGPALQDPPRRLFSARKAISPTSQERLCKALNTIQLQEKEQNLCPRKLSFGKNTRKYGGKAEGYNQLRRVEDSIQTEHFTTKSKEKQSSLPQGYIEVSHSSSLPSRVSTGSYSVQSCSESAIAFVQRQMQDIENVAVKLTNQLESMKAVMEERLHLESHRAAVLKCNPDEMRMAIANANRVEATAKKWLSMMARDCTRFCKIMRLTGKGSTAETGYPVLKQKRISFADEAGGELCQVRLFEDAEVTL